MLRNISNIVRFTAHSKLNFKFIHTNKLLKFKRISISYTLKIITIFFKIILKLKIFERPKKLMRLIL